MLTLRYKALLIFGSTLLSLNLCYAQSAIQAQADRLYENYSYIKAAELYEEIAKNNLADVLVLKKMADSYNKTGNFNKAAEWYEKLFKNNQADAEETYYYAQALKATGKNSEAEIVLNKFHELKKSDSRGIEYMQKRQSLEKLKNAPPLFSVSKIAGNSEQADFSPSYWKDKIVFASSRVTSLASKNTHTWNEKPFLDLYVATADSSNNLTEITKLKGEINTKYHEGPMCFTNDGKTLYFTRNNYLKHKYQVSSKGTNMLELFRAVQNESGKWAIEKLNIDNREYSLGHPTLSKDEKILYFASDMPGGLGGTDIWKSEIKSDGSLSTPVNLGPNVNTEGNEMFPFYGNDHVLYFSSNGHAGYGEMDVFASPINGSDNFGKAMNLGPQINTGKDDFGIVFSKDGKKGFLSSNRDGGKGDDDIYSFTKLRELSFSYLLKGIAYEKGTENILQNASIELLNQDGKPVGKILTNESGAYEFEIEPKQNYNLGGNKEHYFPETLKFNTNELGEVSEIIKDLHLEKDPGLSLYAIITDAKTKQALEGVKVSITQTDNSSFANFTTPQSGDFLKPLSGNKIGDELVYNIRLEKQGYLTKTVTFKKVIDKSGIIKIHEALDLSLGKLEVGGDLAKMIDIKPIYFDLGKYNIRKDASVELDKIVKVMNEYPSMVVELGSHTDCRSSMASNMKLSDNRAKSSAEYIKKRIQHPERIYGKGYGETKLLNGCACEGPVKSTCSEEEHQSNRRTEFIIVKM